MGTILVIDDERMFTPAASAGVGDTIIYMRTSSEAIRFMEDEFNAGRPLFQVFFDHDLGELDDGSTDDTREVAAHLAAFLSEDPDFVEDVVYIHTQNSVAAGWIHDTILDGWPDARVQRLASILGIFMQDPSISR